jgi:hypothetical protein
VTIIFGVIKIFFKKRLFLRVYFINNLYFSLDLPTQIKNYLSLSPSKSCLTSCNSLSSTPRFRNLRITSPAFSRASDSNEAFFVPASNVSFLIMQTKATEMFDDEMASETKQRQRRRAMKKRVDGNIRDLN